MKGSYYATTQSIRHATDEMCQGQSPCHTPMLLPRRQEHNPTIMRLFKVNGKADTLIADVSCHAVKRVLLYWLEVSSRPALQVF